MPLPATLGISAELARFADDELRRMPLLWEQLLHNVRADAQRRSAAERLLMRGGDDEVLRMAGVHWARMGAAYADVLRQHARAPAVPAAAAKPAARSKGGRLVLELVGDEVIALDVELSHTVQAIADAAEQDLRDLQGYLAAMVGDRDVAADHNPFSPAVHGRALRVAAQVLPTELPKRLAFIRAVTPALAAVLQQAYANACARLAERGLEPAQHRCIVSNVDQRWRLMPPSAPLPDLRSMRDAMPQAAGAYGSAAGLGAVGVSTGVAGAIGAVRATGATGAPLPAIGAAELQSVELIDRLFKAFALDERVPTDVIEAVMQLREPAMRLVLRDPTVLDRLEHPIWRLIHVFAYQAEMVPHAHDAERRRWLEFGRRMFEELAAQPAQKGSHYRAAVGRLEEFLERRLARRVEALAKRLEALQRTEAGLASRSGAEDSVSSERQADPADVRATQRWYDELAPGEWLRLMLDGAWVHAQLLWRGDRRQILLFGNDGASKTTWAVRRSVLLKMHGHGLAKTLKMRSLVGTAALRVQEQLAIAVAA
jgi:hypothetical protein